MIINKNILESIGAKNDADYLRKIIIAAESGENTVAKINLNCLSSKEKKHLLKVMLRERLNDLEGEPSGFPWSPWVVDRLIDYL